MLYKFMLLAVNSPSYNQVIIKPSEKIEFAFVSLHFHLACFDV